MAMKRHRFTAEFKTLVAKVIYRKPRTTAPAALCCRGHLRLPASSASLLLSVPLPATRRL